MACGLVVAVLYRFRRWATAWVMCDSLVVIGDDRPTGTVTFLFTDVEGSTGLWAADAEAMSASLRLHDEVLRSVLESHSGYVFSTAGDSFVAAFSRASDAVNAAVAIQEALPRIGWGDGPALKVRIGLHLGEAEERGGLYFGIVVNTAARVEAAGHGGQILLTELVANVCDLALRDLGVQRLRDIPEPVRLYQVGDVDFRPLRGLVGMSTRLPRQANRLVGRDAEVAEVRDLVAGSDLVTITGAGGSGKTRVAIEVAGTVADRYSGRVFFIDLASVGDAASVPIAFAKGLELPITGKEAVLDQVTSHIGTVPMLLVVDNCEHVVDGVSDVVTEILARCDRVSVLATSRELLDVDDEYVYRLPSLSSESSDSPAVQLFVERALAVETTFLPSERDLSTIGRICQQLDGMPLAIELAAARLRTFDLAEIESRLGSRLDLLAGRRRGRLRRHQTLRATIDWSVDLLEDRERTLLRRLGVFVDGWSLGAVAPVAEVSDEEAVDQVDSLVSRSLVERIRVDDGTMRYRLLETLRQWALEECDRVDDLEALRMRHAQYYSGELAQWPYEQWSSVRFYDQWSQETANVVAAVDFVTERDVNVASELLVKFVIMFNSTGRGGWYVDRLKSCLVPQLDERLRAISLFCARLALETQMRLAEQRLLPKQFATRVANEKYDGWARNRYWTEYHRVWRDPFATEERIGNILQEDDLRSASVEIRTLFSGLTTFGYLQTARFTEAVDKALEALPYHQRDMMLVCAGLVAGYLSGDARTPELVAFARGFESRPGLLNIGTDAYALLADESIEQRENVLAQNARSHPTGLVPGVESDYLAAFARLAYERGDRDRARELLRVTRIRQPATLALSRWTMADIDGHPYASVNNIDDYRHSLIEANQLDNPEDGPSTGRPPPQLQERAVFWEEVEAWS